ncbi:MAG: YeeE/YedE thiosulfate transporter family protein [Myxococcota bacterium]|jgi:uncharacterized membrane protein YedE/YeeE|nr:YeeE/YedE thiosulfate transporter family protein [Myxococcota bacterium]
MAPYDVTAWGKGIEVAVSLGIGFSFGFILERAGFGDSRKLASQFYFRDMTVLKVMFTGIVVAMVLLFWAVFLGFVDYGRIFVNPTFLWPGIVGGFILGLGFIVGGYCPGTSLVSAATGKLDGMFFVGGVLLGIFVFGEAAPQFWDFFEGAGEGARATLPEWLGLPTGLVVLGVVLMAVGAFRAAEWAEGLVARRAQRRQDAQP